MVNVEFIKMMDDFFDSNKPCPEKIKNCAELRKQFIEKVENLQKSGGCNACRLRNIKANFYEVVKNNLL